MPPVDLTIGIPVYNNSGDLAACLRSLATNVTLPMELLLVDDCSSEDIRTVAKAFVCSGTGSVQRMMLLRNRRNRGFPHNANLILDEAAAAIVCILNSDTYVCRNALERVVAALRQSPYAVIAGPSTSSANSPQQIGELVGNPRVSEERIVAMALELERFFGDEVQELSQRETNSQIQGFCYCVKKEAVEKIGYFDEIYGLGNYEESDYNSRAEFLCYKALWVKGAYVHHYGCASFGGVDRWALLQKNDAIWREKMVRLTAENVRNVQRNLPEFGREVLFEAPAS